MPFWKQLTDHW